MNNLVKAEYTGVGNYKGYKVTIDNTETTLTDYKLLSISYYDNYDFLTKNIVPNQQLFGFEQIVDYGKRYDEGKGYEAKGQLTGTVTAVFDNSEVPYLYSTMYYDNRKRLIQTKSNNHMGGYETESFAYNFTGQPTRKLHVHSTSAPNSEQSELYTYELRYPEYLIVLDCDCKSKWLKIKTVYKGETYIGWIPPEKQCCNVYSTCS